jgi:hypothetical protein
MNDRKLDQPGRDRQTLGAMATKERKQELLR